MVSPIGATVFSFMTNSVECDALPSTPASLPSRILLADSPWPRPDGQISSDPPGRLHLDVDVDVEAAAGSRTHSYDGYVVDMVLYRVRIPSGQEPHPLRVAELRWVKPQELDDYAFPSADQGTTDLLLGISPDPRC